MLKLLDCLSLFKNFSSLYNVLLLGMVSNSSLRPGADKQMAGVKQGKASLARGSALPQEDRAGVQNGRPPPPSHPEKELDLWLAMETARVTTSRNSFTHTHTHTHAQMDSDKGISSAKKPPKQNKQKTHHALLNEIHHFGTV